MEKISFNYSLQNIPILSKPSYQLKLADKIENVIKRMCWKAHFSIDGNSSDNIKSEAYGFKTKNSPLPCDDLQNFENQSYSKLQNLQYIGKERKVLKPN